MITHFERVIMKKPGIAIKKENQAFQFRAEEFEIVYHTCMNKKTGETFSTEELDLLNLIQVQNQYRAKYGIPFVEEIKSIREQYGLSAAKMSEILGFGTNGYKNYENGEIPSIPHGRYIQLIKDPNEFLKLIELSRNELSKEDLEKLQRKVRQNLSALEQLHAMEEAFLFGDTAPSEFNGYRKPVLEKVGNMAAFFAHALEPFVTQLNKLLFYADFIHYRKSGYSISGLSYRAAATGPAPKKYGCIYSTLYDKEYIYVEIVDLGNGIEGEKLFLKGKQVDLKNFQEREVETLKEVVQMMERKKIKGVGDFGADEDKWKKNLEDRMPISYKNSFYLDML
jgi:DNA-binding transcriptional regulator YiaG